MKKDSKIKLTDKQKIDRFLTYLTKLHDYFQNKEFEAVRVDDSDTARYWNSKVNAVDIIVHQYIATFIGDKN